MTRWKISGTPNDVSFYVGPMSVLCRGGQAPGNDRVTGRNEPEGVTWNDRAVGWAAA